MTQTVVKSARSSALRFDVARRGGSRVKTPAWTTERYREMMGWPARECENRTVLTLGWGMVAVVVPSDLGPGVASELQRQGASGPVFSVRADVSAWVFLADPNGLVANRDILPPGAAIVECPSTVMLPGAGISADTCRWIVPPDPQRRWHPTLATVLAAVAVRTRQSRM